jgi:nitrous oxidase accessory protein
LKKLVYAVLLMLALFTSQNAGNRFLASVDEAGPHSFKNAAEKSFSIQMAVNSADDGDAIYVPPGKYTENLKINKSVKLIANGTVEVTPVNPNDNTVEILKDNVTLMGFTLINQEGIGGIRVGGVAGYRIIGNTILGGDYGLLIEASSKGFVSGNEVRGCLFGIYFRESSENTVSQNTVESCKYGISLSLCLNITVVVNRVVNCTYGLYNHISDRSNVSKNVFQENMMGVVVTRSVENQILLNEILYNFYGVHLDDARRSIVAKNNVAGGLIGVKMQNSYNIALLNNTVRFSTNNIAIDSSLNTTVSGNTLEYAKGHGIIIYETDNSILSWNSISHCRVGISVENCRLNGVEDNSAVQNSYGLYLFRSSEIRLSRNQCVNNTNTDFYSEGSENIIVKNLELKGYGNSGEISFTYRGDVSIRGAEPIGFEARRLLSGFFNITLLSPSSWVKINVTYSLKDIQDIHKEEPVLYHWTGVEWKTLRGSVKNESPLKGSASFQLTETGIYVLGVGEKTVEPFPPIIGIIAIMVLIISSYLVLRILKSRKP